MYHWNIGSIYTVKSQVIDILFSVQFYEELRNKGVNVWRCVSSMKFVTLTVSILLVGGVRAEDSGDNLAVPGYTDTCDYSGNSKVKCGDLCMSSECHCGSSDPFQPGKNGNKQQCCIPYAGSRPPVRPSCTWNQHQLDLEADLSLSNLKILLNS